MAAKRATLEKTVHIEAPVEKVFTYYTDPHNQVEFWPSMIDVRDVQYEGERPVSFAWTYKLAGMKFDGQGRIAEYEPHRRCVLETSGGIKSRNVIEFEPEGEGTRIREEMSYDLPLPLLGRVAERFLLKLGENEFEAIHANVKARMESVTPET